MLAHERIILPLDGIPQGEALALAKMLSGRVWGFKVNDLLIECGVSIIRELKAYGRVFADAKIHDIPNTVANSVGRLAESGADLITIHASGGEEMMTAAVDACRGAKILAVTVLTSLTEARCREVYHHSPQETVLSLATLAARAKVHGVVCSPLELPTLQAHLPHLIKVTPGIRPAWHGEADDQSRTATPQTAVANGATYLVIGRPITRAPSPLEAVDRICTELTAQ
jgi:orotidine-5'-phosphate decarboxylase